jgi:threonine/homoserine/homoserine lactone efflux protein
MDIPVSLATLLAFAWTSLLIELTPGPNMTYLAILSAERGRRAAMAAVAGVAVGLALVGLLAAFGLATLLEQSRVLYETIRWAGALYLLWLAYEAYAAADDPPPPLDHLSALRHFRDGVVTNLLNPKAVLFYVGVLPAFTDEARPLAGQVAWLSLIYVAIATGVHAGIVMLASRAATALTDPGKATALRRVLALLLAAVAVWLLLSTRRSA